MAFKKVESNHMLLVVDPTLFFSPSYILRHVNAMKITCLGVVRYY